jgi:hypothetical protein
MTVTALSHPRRPVVRRAPSPRAAARALRRSAAPTTGRAWTTRGLPGAPRATAGVPLSEWVGSYVVVLLMAVPVFVWTQGAAGAYITLAVTLVAMTVLLAGRRVVVGDSWVAVRQLLRYSVATVDHVRHLELRPTQHGGTLCLHTDDGRCVRVRRNEVADEDVAAALRALASQHEGTRDAHVQSLLGLEHDEQRLADRYLPAAA